MRKTYQNDETDTSRPAVPVTVSVALAELAEDLREGLLALAVGTGLQVMAAMMEAGVTAAYGPHGDKIRNYALMRLALFVGKRHQRGRAWGFAQLYRSLNQLGLISLNGIVVAPRPHRAWRVKPNTAGEERR